MRLFALITAVLILIACSGDDADGSRGAAQSPVATATNTPSVIPSPTATPGGLQIVSLTSSVRRGQSASLAIKSEPNASCTIAYTTPAGTHSEAQGLAPKAADAAGNVAWSWVIGSATNPGTGSIQVVCGGQAVTASIAITS